MRTTGSPIRFAVVGLGHIGKRHVTYIHNHPEAEVAAVCDVRPAAETGYEPAGIPYFARIEALLRADVP